MEPEDIYNIYRNALVRIVSGVERCVDGTVPLDQRDMQAIARKALEDVASDETQLAAVRKEK